MSVPVQYVSLVVDTQDVVILSGQSESQPFQPKGTTPTKIYMPASFDGTQLTFLLSSDNGVTYLPYYNVDDVEVIYSVTQGRVYGLATIDLYGVTHMKIVSDASESADRTLKLVVRGV